jgi:threonine/homoserine/homoserine lactone efflux protein
VFAGFGLGAATDYRAAALLVSGVFLGSAAWWLFLSGATSLLRTKINARWMQAVNRASGTIIFGFGLYALYTVVQR